MSDKEYEVLVIGGGPAGLSAALYLARYDREVALFDTGHGRSNWHQTNFNYLGFPGGVAIRDLVALGLEQIMAYPQVTRHPHRVEHLRRENGGFVASGQAGTWRAPAVILCSGVVDHWPHFEDWQEYVGRSMFWCITCDGYSSRGMRIVVVGDTDDAGATARQLLRFTDKVLVLTNSRNHTVSEKEQALLAEMQIPFIHDCIDRVEGQHGQFEALYTERGQCIELDRLFNQQGATPRSDLAVAVGVEVTPAGYIIVDTEQKTNVPGFYAAGDVTYLHSHQVTTAVHEGGQAASAANYNLYPTTLKED